MSEIALNFSREEYALRLTKVRAAMAERGITTLIVHDPSNMAWLTGYDGWSFYTPQCVVVGQHGNPLWYGRGIDANGARRTVYLPEEDIASYSDRYVMNPPHHALDYLCQEVLPARGWISGVIGVEMDNYYYSATSHQALQRGLPQAQLMDATGLVNWCRAIKSPQEIEYMRVAARIVENMHRAIIEMVEPGLPKNVLVGEIYRVACVGHEGKFGDYPAIVPMLPSGKDASAESGGVGGGHQPAAVGVQEQRYLLGFQQPFQLMPQRRQFLTQGSVAALGGVLHLLTALLQLQTHRHPGNMLLFQLIAEAGELIDPGLDAIAVATRRENLELALPGVVAQIFHDVGVPDRGRLVTPAHPHGQLVVSVAEHLAAHRHCLPGNGLHRKRPAIEHRLRAFNGNARQQQGLRQWQMRMVILRIVLRLHRLFGRHRASPLTPHGRSCA